MTGLLTSGERDFLRGETDVENPEQYRRNIRYKTRQRMDEIDNDLGLLNEAGEDELRDEFFTQFDPHRRVEDDVDELCHKVSRLEAAVDVEEVSHNES